MAFSRKFLASLGIDSDKIDTIIEAHAGVVEALKDEISQYKGKAETADSLQKQVDDLQEQLSQSNTDDYKAKYDELSTEYAEYKNGVESRQALADKTNAYKALLKAAGIPDNWTDRVIKSTDLSKIETDKDGNIKDADKLAESVKSDWGDVIPTQKETGLKTPTPPTASAKSYTEDDIKKMSIDEINANWDAIKASLNNRGD